MTAQGLILALTLAFPGACCGSFIATAVVRGERGEQALTGRSRCDHCHGALAFHQTVPLVSYVLHRGVCTSCRGRIDPLHPLGEVGGVLVAISLALAPIFDLRALTTRLILAGLGFVLLALCLQDYRTLRLPDVLVGCVLMLSTALAALSGTLLVGLLTGGVAFILLELVRRSFLAVRGEHGLGFGDVKLLSALGVWLGPLTPWAMVSACGLTLLARIATLSLSGRTPFGPAIACAAWIVGLSGGPLAWLG